MKNHQNFRNNVGLNTYNENNNNAGYLHMLMIDVSAMNNEEKAINCEKRNFKIKKIHCSILK